MKNTTIVLFLTALVILVPFSTRADTSELIRNGSFETVPDNSYGQGYMPSEWQTISESPDTYSVDGSYGLWPSDYGDFIGATAHDGLRWVAGYSTAAEAFGQKLSAPLVQGQTYQLSAYLLQSVRWDLAHPGSYEVSLFDSTRTKEFTLGEFDWSINQNVWEKRTLTFVAPANADFISFMPISGAEGSAYTGIDLVSLTTTAAPEPISTALFLLGGATLAARRLRRK